MSHECDNCGDTCHTTADAKYHFCSVECHDDFRGWDEETESRKL